MSTLRESIFSCERKQVEVDLSDFANTPGAKGTMVELTLGDRERMESAIGKSKDNNLVRAAYIVFCLHEDNENGELMRVFQDDDVERVSELPWMKLHPLYEKALMACRIIDDSETVESDEQKN